MEREGKLLYFAPEPGILTYLKANPRLQVKTSNYHVPGADYDLDIMDTRLPDSSWDYIVCHHVIEHVPDDRKALAELYRLLKPGGTLIFSVPIRREKTLDYGAPNAQDDGHFYSYGLDFQERIPRDFRVSCLRFSDMFSREEFDALGLEQDYVFVCTKPASAGRAEAAAPR